MPAAILGDRACGKTTFLGLLYTSQIKYTNDLENRDLFKFYAEPAVVSSMGDIYTQMKNQGWPDATVKGQLTKYSFLFGYKKTWFDFLPGQVQDALRKTEITNPYLTMKFTVFDVAGEDVQDIIRTPDGVFAEEVPEVVKSLLDSRVLVILLDASRVTAKPRTKAFVDMLTYDKNMASLVSLIAEYNSRKEKAERKIYPIFILTKFDAIADTPVLEEIGLKGTYPAMEDQKARSRYAEVLLRNFFKQTLALIKGGTLKNVSFDEAQYFYSEIGTEFNEDGFPVPKLVKTGGGWDVDFSYDEYRGFIDYIKVIITDMPPELKDAQDFREEKKKK